MLPHPLSARSIELDAADRAQSSGDLPAKWSSSWKRRYCLLASPDDRIHIYKLAVRADAPLPANESPAACSNSE
jgi:hypothetical protein